MTVSFLPARTKRTRDGRYAGGLTAGQLAPCFHLMTQVRSSWGPALAIRRRLRFALSGYKTECRPAARRRVIR